MQRLKEQAAAAAAEVNELKVRTPSCAHVSHCSILRKMLDCSRCSACAACLARIPSLCSAVLCFSALCCLLSSLSDAQLLLREVPSLSFASVCA